MGTTTDRGTDMTMTTPKFSDVDQLKRLLDALEGLDKAGVIVTRDTNQAQKDLACHNTRQALSVVRANWPNL